jgi:hypothetical protein
MPEEVYYQIFNTLDFTPFLQFRTEENSNRFRNDYQQFPELQKRAVK